MSRATLIDVTLGRLRFMLWRRFQWKPMFERYPFCAGPSWLLWWGPFWFEWIAPAADQGDGELPFLLVLTLRLPCIYNRVDD